MPSSSSSSSSSSPLLLQQSPMSSPSTPSPPDPHKDPWYPYSNGAHFDSNIAMILIFIFCALVCALALNAAIRFFLRLSRQQDQEATDHHQGGGGGDKQLAPQLSPLHSLPTLVFSSGTKMKLAGAEEEEAECAICLSEFVDGESVRILPKCKHGFHVKCIQGWLSSHMSCPTCRTTCLITSSPSPNHHNYDLESPPPPPPPPAPPLLQLQPQQLLQVAVGEHQTDRQSQ